MAKKVSKSSRTFNAADVKRMRKNYKQDKLNSKKNQVKKK